MIHERGRLDAGDRPQFTERSLIERAHRRRLAVSITQDELHRQNVPTIESRLTPAEIAYDPQRGERRGEECHRESHLDHEQARLHHCRAAKP